MINSNRAAGSREERDWESNRLSDIMLLYNGQYCVVSIDTKRDGMVTVEVNYRF